MKADGGCEQVILDTRADYFETGMVSMTESSKQMVGSMNDDELQSLVRMQYSN